MQYPTAVDIGDGAFLDDLGLSGAQGTVEITFLWLGRDPQGDAQAAAPAPISAPVQDGSVVVGTNDGGFAPYAKQEWYEKKGSCSASGRTLWTYSAPTPADAENGARWSASLPPGSYDVQVFVPSCKNKAGTGAAHYAISSADGRAEVSIDQGGNLGKWVTLGRFRFGDSGTVELSDITGEEQRVVWFDAVRWVPAR